MAFKCVAQIYSDGKTCIIFTDAAFLKLCLNFLFFLLNQPLFIQEGSIIEIKNVFFKESPRQDRQQHNDKRKQGKKLLISKTFRNIYNQRSQVPKDSGNFLADSKQTEQLKHPFFRAQCGLLGKVSRNKLELKRFLRLDESIPRI